jgi:predicted transcriptional regulator
MVNPNVNQHLTGEERERIDQFLNLFTAIEGELQKRLRVPTTTQFSRLLREYRLQNPYWQEDAEDLGHYAQIRNFLTHERTPEFGYPVAVTRQSVERLESILKRLQTPRQIGECYRRSVVTVTSDQTLVDVLQLAYRNKFSQFPVVDRAKFQGVVTENEIARWLGHQVTNGRTQVELSGVTVLQVMREHESERVRGVIFDFRRLDAPEDEVMGLFQQRPALEVVLLTASGEQDTPIEGIVTQWDAARFPKSPK